MDVSKRPELKRLNFEKPGTRALPINDLLRGRPANMIFFKAPNISSFYGNFVTKSGTIT